jgi:hypothetical protein
MESIANVVAYYFLICLPMIGTMIMIDEKLVKRTVD